MRAQSTEFLIILTVSSFKERPIYTHGIYSVNITMNLIDFLFIRCTQVFDKHNRGYITASDLRAVLQCLGEDLSEEESKYPLLFLCHVDLTKKKRKLNNALTGPTVAIRADAVTREREETYKCSWLCFHSREK